jgi:hypothetical protein
MSVMASRLNFDIKMFWATFRLKGVFGPSWTKSKKSQV